MSNKSNAELSRMTIAAMDMICYSKEKIESRADLMRRIIAEAEKTFKQSVPGFDLDFVLTGSKGDGIAKLFESDIDVMIVLRKFLCLDNARLENELNIIQILSTDSPPGYTKLNPLDMECNSFGAVFLGFTSAYDLNRGQVFLSSTCARNLMELAYELFPLPYEGVHRQMKQQCGPSVPASISLNIFTITAWKFPATESDNVIALPYISSSILDVWKKRNRKWPPPHLCQEVSETEGFVVPVGSSYSEEQNFEWRISFTKGENILVSHFSSVQLKLYILLKMVFKKIVKPNCGMITSYIVKNILFWVAERNNLDMFTPDKLIDLLLQCLAFLRECLHSNFLPNYMIPSRNLLLGKGTPHDKIKLNRTLTDILEDSDCVVMRLDTIRNSIRVIYQSPVSARQYSEMRDDVEKLAILTNLIVCSKMSPALMQQSTFVYDLLFEFFKEPSFFGILFSLFSLLNVDLSSFASNPGQLMELLYGLLS
ncbi:uncharacterized protein LOC123529613 [Mercenaria mercenaria]|uniref:uncharacterized protein LOC123529613 n=1 Tax=Mercenaria mercenaria TaxID=6596 RepID=UPI00234E933D|nr:uncharacterized protein LOC123529613 [Mercenaria mercenaria]